MTEDDLRKVLGEKRACPDCKAGIGDLHSRGCDVERCPRCGDQAISCDCLNGLTDERIARWNAEWSARRMAWTGWWPGDIEAVELDLWCAWGPEMNPPRPGWVQVPPGTPGAQPDLNALATHTTWDPDTQRRVLLVRPQTPQ